MTSDRSPTTALRLTFTYQGDDVRLTGVRGLDAKPPLSDALDGYDEHAGFWLEVRDADGHTVFRRVLHDPMPVYHEVHSQPGQPSTHVPVRERSGTFEIVVPAAEPGSAAVLFASPRPAPAPIGEHADERARAPVPRAPTEPAREVARFALEEPSS